MCPCWPCLSFSSVFSKKSIQDALFVFMLQTVASYLIQLLCQPVSRPYNRVTHCLPARASHCVCGPQAAKQPYHLHVSIFIVDIYFCNYFSTSPSAKDDMQELTLVLPSSGLLLLKYKNHKKVFRRSKIWRKTFFFLLTCCGQLGKHTVKTCCN